jgi:hypothetical protein
MPIGRGGHCGVIVAEFGAASLEDDLLRNRKGTLSAVVNNHHGALSYEHQQSNTYA